MLQFEVKKGREKFYCQGYQELQELLDVMCKYAVCSEITYEIIDTVETVEEED